MPIRVALVEDQQKTLNSLALLLGQATSLQVVATFTSGEEALAVIPKIRPHVTLVDLGLPGISGIEVIKRLREALPRMEILVLTIYEDRNRLFSALKAGASGYLLKDSTTEEIIEAIETIYRGGSPMSPRVARYVIEFFQESKARSGKGGYLLSNREREILNGIAEGLSAKRLADRLCISPHTVRTHIKNIYEKLHVHSKVEAVLKAKETGMI